MLGVHVHRQAREIHRLAARLQLVAPMLEIDRLIGQQHRARRRDGAHAQVDVEILLQPSRLRARADGGASPPTFPAPTMPIESV